MLGGRPVVHVTYDGRMSDFGERMGLAPQARSGARLVVRRGVPRLERDRDAFQGIESFVDRTHAPGRCVAPDVVTVGDDVPFAHGQRISTTTGDAPDTTGLGIATYQRRANMDPSHPSKTTCAKYLAASIAMTALACGGSRSSVPATASSRVFIGDVPDTDVRVGIIATDRHARVFFCGGPSSYATMTRWLPADVDAAHKLTLQVPGTETWTLEGEVGDGGVVGSVDMGDAMARPFRAIPVLERTMAGLYEGTAPCGKLGLIVLQPTVDGTPVGQGACVGPTTIEQVNPLAPILRASDGTIRVSVGASAEEEQVRAATPPLD